MDGYGTTHTDTVSQSVSIPVGCTATFSFYLHIDTAETTTGTAYDKLTVKAGSTTLATYSNLNHNTGYAAARASRLPAGTTSVSFTGNRGLLAADLVRHRRHRIHRVLTRPPVRPRP